MAKVPERVCMARAVPVRPGDFASLDAVGCWRKTQRPAPGTHFVTRVRIGKRYYRVMLDGGATCNTVPSDIMLLVLNDARSMDPAESPVLDLMDYAQDPVVIDGVRKGAPLKVTKGAELRLDMVPMGVPPETSGVPRVVTTFHVANAEEFDPGMIVLGGPSLRKMGHQPKDDQHVFSKLRVAMPKLDDGSPASLKVEIYRVREAALGPEEVVE